MTSRYFDNNSSNVPVPHIIVDGVETLSQHLNSLIPQNVSSIEVLHEPLSFVLGPKGMGGAILITTKGVDEMNIPVESENISFINPLGYQVTREFYSPGYDTNAKVESGIPDERITIYWNPNVELDNQGKGYFEFYTSDSDKGQTIVVEGITEDGKILMRKLIN